VDLHKRINEATFINTIKNYLLFKAKKLEQMSKPKTSPFKGYRNMKRGFPGKMIEIVEKNPSKWVGGTLFAWAEFKKSFYNDLRVGRGWNLEKPATEEEKKTHKPSGVADEEEVAALRANCNQWIETLNAEELIRIPQPVRGRPAPQLTQAERVNQLILANEYKAKRQNRLDNLREDIAKLNERAATAARQWTVDNNVKELRDSITLKIFNDRFRRLDLELVDEEFLQVANFRGALAKLETIFVGEAPKGQALMFETRRLIECGTFKYKKSEGIDPLIEKVETAHKLHGLPEDVSWGIIHEAILKGDDEQLKRQMEAMQPSMKTYSKFKKVLREQIILNRNTPKNVLPRETANIASHQQDRERKPCRFCGMSNHTDDKCHTQMICKKCGKMGHIAYKCKSGNQNQNVTETAQNKTQPPPKRKLNLVANFEETVGKKNK